MVEQLGMLVLAALGAVIGSFLNVVIYRLPRGESLAFPPSHCPACGARIRPWHNIPVVGFLWLRGKCKDCGGSISLRYPFVEALCAGLSAGLWLRYGLSAELAAYLVLVLGLVAVTFIDVDHMIIPDSLSLGGIAVGFGSSFFTAVGWRASLGGALLGAGILLAVYLGYYALTRREGMGLGDVKLLGAIGAFLGWPAVLFTVFVSSVVGSLWGILAPLCLNVVRRGTPSVDLRRAMPFGGFLALGAVLYVYWGEVVVRWYLGTLR